jgi:hypothetical protein
MSMGRREPDQPPLWIAASDLPTSPGHPFYARLNEVLDTHRFDRFAESRCREFYAKVMGRPSLAPGQYFRLLLVGYFEGIDSERGIAWRAADSLAPRRFVRLALDEAAPDHSTLSRTRRLIDVETHRAVFRPAYAPHEGCNRGCGRAHQLPLPFRIVDHHDATRYRANAVAEKECRTWPYRTRGCRW